MTNTVQKLLAILLLGLLIFLGFNRHSRDSFDDYHSVLWSDAAGYHAYLPYLLDGHFLNMSSAEEHELISKTGRGFELNDGEFFSKYSVGVAILQSPGYLFARLTGDDPFAPSYHYSVLVTGVVLGWLGLLLLIASIRALRVDYLHAVMISMLVFLGTNLFYYTVDSPGYSHVYSFFAFNLFFYLVLYSDLSKTRSAILIGLVLALIYLIRPFNLPFVILFGIGVVLIKEDDGLENLFHQKIRAFLLMTAPVVAAVILQVALNFSMSSELIIDSYKNESFSNLGQPKLLEVLFSTRNGLILYSPVWIVLLASLLTLKNQAKWLALSAFFLLLYAYSSWWNWELGCSFGYRGITEYGGIFALFFSLKFNHVHRTKLNKTILIPLLFLTALWSIKLMYTYDECWMDGIWSYDVFFEKLLLGSTR